MRWLLNNYLSAYPQSRYIWARVRMRYETEKAILVLYEEAKVWLPKSRIGKVKLKKGVFWIYVPEANLRQHC